MADDIVERLRNDGGHPDLAQRTAVRDDLCKCKAHDDANEDSYHTAKDHRGDCWSWPPCGGCWSCMAMTVARWEEARRG